MTLADIRSPDAPSPGFAVQAVALDLDGTCLDDRQRLHPRVRRCVRGVSMRLPVVVATGRMYRSAWPWTTELGTSAPMVCYQGAWVREHTADGEVGAALYERELAPQPSLRALQLSRENGWHINAYQDDELLCDQDRPEARLYSTIANVPIRFVDDLEPILRRGSTKLACVITDVDEVRRSIETLQRELNGTARVTRSLPQFVEIVDPLVSKATAVDVALKQLGTSLANAVAIGDAPNDIEMLSAAGFAVAVREAPEDVLAHADATCEAPERAGVADALQALSLC